MQICGEISVDNTVFGRDKYCHDAQDSTAYTLCN